MPPLPTRPADDPRRTSLFRGLARLLPYARGCCLRRRGGGGEWGHSPADEVIERLRICRRLSGRTVPRHFSCVPAASNSSSMCLVRRAELPRLGVRKHLASLRPSGGGGPTRTPCDDIKHRTEHAKHGVAFAEEHRLPSGRRTVRGGRPRRGGVICAWLQSLRYSRPPPGMPHEWGHMRGIPDR